jgi:hypothetical protein
MWVFYFIIELFKFIYNRFNIENSRVSNSNFSQWFGAFAVFVIRCIRFRGFRRSLFLTVAVFVFAVFDVRCFCIRGICIRCFCHSLFSFSRFSTFAINVFAVFVFAVLVFAVFTCYADIIYCIWKFNERKSQKIIILIIYKKQLSYFVSKNKMNSNYIIILWTL